MKGTTQAYYYANTCRKEAISSSRDILVTDRSTKELNERTNVRMSRRANERMSVRVNEPTNETTDNKRADERDNGRIPFFQKYVQYASSVFLYSLPFYLIQRSYQRNSNLT